MKLQIAIAANSERVSADVRARLKKSYSSLFSQAFYKVLDVPDRSKSNLKLVREMPETHYPVVVEVEDSKHASVTFVAAVSVHEPLMGNVSPTVAYIMHDNTTTKYTLEPRLIKVRGIEYAIASLVARQSSVYLDLGDN